MRGGQRGSVRQAIVVQKSSDGDYRKAGEGCGVEAGVQREEAVAVAQGVSADQEVGEDTAGGGALLVAAARRIGLKGATSGAPSGLVNFPFDRDTGFPEECLEEGFTAAGKGEKLGIDRRGDDQQPAIPRGPVSAVSPDFL